MREFGYQRMHHSPDDDSASKSAEGLAQVAQGHVKICDALEEWTRQSRRMYDAHAAQQERLAAALLAAHRETLQEIEILTDRGVNARLPPERNMRRGAGCESPPSSEAAPYEEKTLAYFEGIPEVVDLNEASQQGENEITGRMKALRRNDEIMEWWRRTSGLHTVKEWVVDYKKHPAGWAALLMIHGIPEVIGRLRNKVENYAIYSALFLSVSLGLLASPPESMTVVRGAEDHVRTRLYFYALAFGTSAHVLCILLGMSFVEALNEAARDSDVYRMFSRGRGFIATVKCQWAFRFGCAADTVGVAAAVCSHISLVEVLAGAAFILLLSAWIFISTAGPLFENASIVKYWRNDLGGKPDEDDPYDLEIPVSCFQERACFNQNSSAGVHNSRSMFRAWRASVSALSSYAEAEQKPVYGQRNSPHQAQGHASHDPQRRDRSSVVGMFGMS